MQKRKIARQPAKEGKGGLSAVLTSASKGGITKVHKVRLISLMPSSSPEGKLHLREKRDLRH